MIAIILIGGQGARLKPLTLRTPKPLLPLVNRPCLEYQFDVLKSHGVREAVLCTSYRAEAFKKIFGDGKKYGLRLHYRHEPEPLGTGGALKNAESLIRDTALVLNGDMLYDLPIGDFLRFHRGRRSELSIALTRVQDPGRYGLVALASSRRVLRFIEKPSENRGRSHTVNAGAYIIEPSLLNDIPSKAPYSLERELFPRLLRESRRIFGFVTRSYWLDIGTFDKYLQGHADILRGNSPFRPHGVRSLRGMLAGPGVRLGRNISVDTGNGRVVLGRSTKVHDGASLTGPLCVGPSSVIGEKARLEGCVLLGQARIGEGAKLSECLVGPHCRVVAYTDLSRGMIWK